MHHDDQQRDQRLHGNEKRWTATAKKEPRKDRKAGRTDHRTQRDIAAERQNKEEHPMAASAAQGAATRKTPKPVATPLPPRNPSQTGNMWPSTAKSAARASALRRSNPGVKP